MKIILFLNKDLEANIAYNLLKPELSKHQVQIYYTEKVGGSNQKSEDVNTLEYFETEFFFNEISEFISRSKIKTDFEMFNKDFKSVPFMKSGNVNGPVFIEKIKAFEPDLFISIRFGKIFRDEIISLPKYGLLNLHSGILPDFRGIMGTLHALKLGNKKIGCTLHTIPDSGIDTGDIVDLSYLEVQSDKSLLWHIVQLYPLGVKMICNALINLSEHIDFELKKQDINTGNYFSVPTEGDFEILRNLGKDVFSELDYINILEEFVTGKLSKLEKHELLKIIEFTAARS